MNHLMRIPQFPVPPSSEKAPELSEYLRKLHIEMTEYLQFLATDIRRAITTTDMDDLANTSLADPGADRIVFWDDGAGYYTWLAPDDSSLEISTTTLQVKADGINDTHIDWGTGANQVSAVDVPIADSGGYYAATEVEAALQEAGLELLLHNLGGFEDASTVALSSNGGTPPTITLTFTGTVYWWSAGVRYSDSGTDAIQIDDTSGLHIIYYDGATLSKITNPSEAQTDAIIVDKCIVAMVYWNTNTDVAILLAKETHGLEMSGETHHWLHDNMGAKYKSGGTLSGYTLSTSSDVAVSFDLTDIEFYDEDLEFDIEDGVAANQYEQVLTGDAEIPALYKDDVDGSWVEQAASTLPYILQGGDTYTSYNNDDGDGTWSLIELGNQKFMLQFLAVTNDWQYPVKMVLGSAEYNTAATARAAINTEVVNWGTLPAAEFILMYVFVLKASAGGTKNVQIIEIEDFRLSEVTGASYTPTDHGVLSGLADDDHTQYILHSLATAADDFLVASGAGVFVKKTLAETGAILEGDINHDNLVDYVANEHIDHTAVTLTAGAGLTGGGDISANRTFAISHLGFESLTDPAADSLVMWDDTDNALKFIVVGANLTYDHATYTLNAAPAAASHDMLSATHSDTTASAVTRGSIVIGDSTPKWVELPIGANTFVLTSDGTDVSWAAAGGGAGYWTQAGTDIYYDDGGSVTIGTTDHSSKMTEGLTIFQGVSDDEILAFQSSDVAHGITTWADTDTYFNIKKNDGARGGVSISAFTDSGATRCMNMGGWSPSVTTLKTTAGAHSVVEFFAIKTSGVTYTAMDATANLVSIYTYIGGGWFNRWWVDANGDTYQAGDFYCGDQGANQAPQQTIRRRDSNNIWIGVDGGDAWTSGDYNVCFGDYAGEDIAAGHSNTLIGHNAGMNISTGIQNVAIGHDALEAATAVYNCIAIGKESLESHNSGNGVIAIGSNAAWQDGSVPQFNIYIGHEAGQTAASLGANQIAIGYHVLQNCSGAENVAIGYLACSSAMTGASNLVVGSQAGAVITSGNQNTILGADAGDNIGSGSDNVAIGFQAGNATSSGSQNVWVGSLADGNFVAARTNSIGIGYNVSVTADNMIIIGNSSHSVTYLYGDVTVQAGAGAGSLTLPGSCFLDSAATHYYMQNNCSLFGRNVGDTAYVKLVRLDTLDHLELNCPIGKRIELQSDAANMAYIANGTGLVLEANSGSLTCSHGTETLVLVDSGSAGATEQDWIEVTVGGNTGYIRVYSAK